MAEGSTPAPDLTYFVEFPPEWCPPEERGQRLDDMFSATVRDDRHDRLSFAQWLAQENNSVSIAMSTLDPPTADAIHRLNESGVRVTPWIVLPEGEGYWTNRSNIDATERRTMDTLEWFSDNNLRLARVGFDIEKPLDYLRAASSFNPSGLLRAARSYRALVREQAKRFDPVQRMEGLLHDVTAASQLPTDAYVFPRPLKHLFGGMDIQNADRYVEMVYLSALLPSFMHLGGRAVNHFLSEGATPALGLVNGVPGETPGRRLTRGLPSHLSETQLIGQIGAILDDDLETPNIYIFALNHPSVAQMGQRALRALGLGLAG